MAPEYFGPELGKSAKKSPCSSNPTVNLDEMGTFLLAWHEHWFIVVYVVRKTRLWIKSSSLPRSGTNARRAAPPGFRVSATGTGRQTSAVQSDFSLLKFFVTPIVFHFCRLFLVLQGSHIITFSLWWTQVAWGLYPLSWGCVLPDTIHYCNASSVLSKQYAH